MRGEADWVNWREYGGRHFSDGSHLSYLPLCAGGGGGNEGGEVIGGDGGGGGDGGSGGADGGH